MRACSLVRQTLSHFVPLGLETFRQSLSSSFNPSTPPFILISVVRLGLSFVVFIYYSMDPGCSLIDGTGDGPDVGPEQPGGAGGLQPALLLEPHSFGVDLQYHLIVEQSSLIPKEDSGYPKHRPYLYL